MRCPACGTEAAVMDAWTEKRAEGAVRVLEFRCRNKRCPDYGHTVGRQSVDRR